MSDLSPKIFADSKIMVLARLLRVTHRWQVRYLADVLRELPATVASYRTIWLKTPASRTESFLHWVEKDPSRRIGEFLDLKTGGTPEQRFSQVLNDHDGFAQLQYHVAALLAPEGYEVRRIEDGSARDVLLHPRLHRGLIRQAALSAQAACGKPIKRGKGGKRRRAEPLERQIVDYLLEISVTVTGRLPRVSNFMFHDRIGGPAVEFLRVALREVGLSVPSGSTLARWISAFRRRH